MSWKIPVTLLLILFVASAFYINDMISSAGKISVSIEKMELTGIGLQSATLNLTLGINNPSNYHYSAEEINYEVYVGGSRMGNGTARNLEIPPRSKIYQSSLMTLYYSELGKAAISFLVEGKLDININGTAKMRVLFFPVEVRFSETRTIRR
ncbi:MAG: LEA type 2 family protein [Candidatus Methanodesulfokora sp.]|jgi:LEA14-like dessication related protein